VTVSALGDSKSLQGGTLLVTPLLGADGEVYAVAQGLRRHRRLRRGGGRGEDHPGRADRRPHLQRGADRARGRVPAERPEVLRLSLRNPDFTTAKRIARAINDFLGADAAEPTDPSTIGLQCRPASRAT
jgi:flagellar P-ring protein precursor FlgI